MNRLDLILFDIYCVIRDRPMAFKLVEKEQLQEEANRLLNIYHELFRNDTTSDRLRIEEDISVENEQEDVSSLTDINATVETIKNPNATSTVLSSNSDNYKDCSSNHTNRTDTIMEMCTFVETADIHIPSDQTKSDRSITEPCTVEIEKEATIQLLGSNSHLSYMDDMSSDVDLKK